MSKLEKWSGGSLVLAFAVIALLIILFHTFAAGGLSEWWAKQDAPAWVQAVGSIAAILASGQIAGRQIRYTQDTERERDRQMRRTRLHVCRHIFIPALTFINRMPRRAEWFESSVIKQHVEQMEGLSKRILAIPQFELNDAQLIEYLDTTFRTLAGLCSIGNNYLVVPPILVEVATPMPVDEYEEKYLAGQAVEVRAALDYCNAELRLISTAEELARDRSRAGDPTAAKASV